MGKNIKLNAKIKFAKFKVPNKFKDHILPINCILILNQS